MIKTGYYKPHWRDFGQKQNMTKHVIYASICYYVINCRHTDTKEIYASSFAGYHPNAIKFLLRLQSAYFEPHRVGISRTYILSTYIYRVRDVTDCPLIIPLTLRVHRERFLLH